MFFFSVKKKKKNNNKNKKINRLSPAAMVRSAFKVKIIRIEKTGSETEIYYNVSGSQLITLIPSVPWASHLYNVHWLWPEIVKGIYLKVNTGAILDVTKITGASLLFQTDFPRLLF